MFRGTPCISGRVYICNYAEIFGKTTSFTGGASSLSWELYRMVDIGINTLSTLFLTLEIK